MVRGSGPGRPETGADDVRGRLDPVVHAELGEGVVDVVLHRAFGDADAFWIFTPFASYRHTSSARS